MKKIITLLLILSFFASCKPTASVITSKTVAQKKGVYKLPDNSKTVAKQNSKIDKKESVSKKTDKKRILNNSNDDDYVINVDDSSYLVKQLINSASDNLGSKYKTGGTTPDGFDCSGLMYCVFKKYDISLPRSSFDMAKKGRKLSNNEIRKGDLIFFRTNGKSVINHVGMVIEVNDDEIKFIHSSTSSGVIVSSTKEAYYNKTFAQANRIIE